MIRRTLQTILFIGLGLLTLSPDGRTEATQGTLNLSTIVSRFGNEHLEFSLYYKGINVAASSMWMSAKGDGAQISWSIKTRPLSTLLFKIDNRYDVLIRGDGRLVQANKKIEQKNIQDEWQVVYDWTSLTARSNHAIDWPVHADCQNVLSMLYDLRRRRLTEGDSVEYILDVESQIWRAIGRVEKENTADGNSGVLEIVFTFRPALEIQQRRWKTDLLTNRLARRTSDLVIRLSPPPARLPLLLCFGSKDERVEMKLTNSYRAE